MLQSIFMSSDPLSHDLGPFLKSVESLFLAHFLLLQFQSSAGPSILFANITHNLESTFCVLVASISFHGTSDLLEN